MVGTCNPSAGGGGELGGSMGLAGYLAYLASSSLVREQSQEKGGWYLKNEIGDCPLAATGCLWLHTQISVQPSNFTPFSETLDHNARLLCRIGLEAI